MKIELLKPFLVIRPSLLMDKQHVQKINIIKPYDQRENFLNRIDRTHFRGEGQGIDRRMEYVAISNPIYHLFNF